MSVPVVLPTVMTLLGLGIAIALAMAVLLIVMHYEGLNLLEQLAYLERHWLRHKRPRIIMVMLGVVGLHLLEIGLMGVIYALLAELKWGFVQQLSDIHGVFMPSDYLYFSAVMYTSLGLGDLVPHGIFKTLAPVEALIGLILIAWSASFTYVQMQRLWGQGR